MGQTLWNGLSGLTAANQWLNQIGDNLANLETPGFAEDQGTFADALTMQVYGNETDQGAANRVTPPGWRGGSGVLAEGEGRNFANMNLETTGNPMNVAINGPGFFVVAGPQGKLYTRAGDFIWSKRPDGQFQLATQTGDPVLSTTGQPILKPANATSMTVSANGQILFGSQTGPRIAVVEIGQPSAHLIPEGDNLYSLAAGGQASPATQSKLVQGALLTSNVNESEQMSNMIEAQNLYDENAESVTIANQMLSIADSIRQNGG
ncbi:flagellar basal-body rod protein FlgG [Alicyclobacillus hesperidum subsp. aegles]|uniref:flagellar hook-basal body protein n=1 Tax=Alicyclobacillus hesperidum TaxID=89784 RepID=UPI00222C2971|nr:flagellar hook-basal body protein [Alicyclobacillus hesperidum]GLG02028.1 flagellar basal-body rod protein FlgG [Alicyclobacillus hesperidum subsp. aegles]